MKRPTVADLLTEISRHRALTAAETDWLASLLYTEQYRDQRRPRHERRRAA
ncbi:MAG: hypothetical protein ABW043_16995 [Devosia sp.]|uniref:hypothetical protein n=1 Tax=Devosia sp. TaxID=1871048 RepID=UPI003396CFEC